MSDGTGIEWCDSTWNVVIGCDKVSSGCDHCYAIRTAHRMQSNPNPKVQEPYTGTEAGGEWTGRVNLVGDRLTLPLSWRKPRRIFVNAQSDLFHDKVPDEFIAQVWGVMAWAPWHAFQILTKRHARMRSLIGSTGFKSLVDDAWYDIGRRYELTMRKVAHPGHPYDRWPLPNVWLGVSAEDQRWADIRVPALLGTPAAVRFISAEPLLGPIDLLGEFENPGPAITRTGVQTRPNTPDGPAEYDYDDQVGIDWVIVGGESGPGARPMHPDWARGLRDQCQAAGVAFLFKQHGEWISSQAGMNEVVANGRRLRYPRRGLRLDGSSAEPFEPCALVDRVGKKRAGRELDGRTWDEYPDQATRLEITQ